jgi:glycosyltransferase involved in cell wall biosynthesis
MEGSDISVVMSAYNTERFIADALKSILSQTVPPGEIIVVDDRSTDRTSNIAASSGARVICLDANVGCQVARNIGIAAANGSWIACCDSDDRWLPGKLEKQLEFLNSWQGTRPIVALGTAAININEAGVQLSPFPCHITTEEEFDRCRVDGALLVFPHSSVMYERDIALEVGGYRRDWVPEDLDLWIRLADHGVVLGIPEGLTEYRKRLSSLSQRNFWGERVDLVRLHENAARRKAGRSELNHDEMVALLAQKPWRERVRTRISWVGQYSYRTGACRVVNGRRASGVAYLALASLLEPRRMANGVLARFRRQ